MAQATMLRTQGMRYLIAGFAVALLMAPAAQATTASQQAAIAQSQGPAGVRASLDRAEDRPALAKALLDRATVSTRHRVGADEGGVSALGGVSASAVSMRGCRARSYMRHVIALAGVKLATQTVFQNGFCWHSFRIVSTERESARRWSAFAYCWKDTSSGEFWVRRDGPGPWISPDRRRAWAQGTLGGNTGVGCVGLQSDRPRVDFNGVGQVQWR